MSNVVIYDTTFTVTRGELPHKWEIQGNEHYENFKAALRFLSSNRRIGGCYPMTVIEIKGMLYVKDAAGVCMPIPEREDDFNCVDYDFIVEQ